MPIVALSAVVPSLLLVWYFHSRDVHPEPSKVLWTTFGLGIVIVIPVLMVGLPMAAVLEEAQLPPYLKGLAQAFLTAAVPEEGFKLLVLLLYAARHDAFDEPMDGVIYGVIASLGFATFENVLYTRQGGLNVAILRAITAVPMHAFCGAVMGYYVGLASFPREFGLPPTARRNLLIKAFVFPTLIHGLYDFPLLTLQALGDPESHPPAEVGGLMLGALVVLIGGVVWGYRLVNQLHRHQQAMVDKYFELVDGEDPGPGATSGWVLMLLGVILSGVGGTLMMAGDEQTALIALLIGLAPLLGGVFVFLMGLRRLPRRPRRRTTLVKGWVNPEGDWDLNP